MNANDFADFVVEIIKSEPEEFIQFIQNEDWEGLQNELYYHACNAAEG